MKEAIDVRGRKTRSLEPRSSGTLVDPFRNAVTSYENSNNALPVWVRAPQGGSEFYSGFGRAKLYELAAKGLIRSVSMKEPGRKKGVRLFYLRSILELVERCERGEILKPELRQEGGQADS